MTRRRVTDDQYGQLSRRCGELMRRVDEGALPFDATMRKLQGIIEQLETFQVMKSIHCTVDEDYCPETALAEWNQFNCQVPDGTIFQDSRFASVSHRLEPGKQYLVQLVRVLQPLSGQECVELYKRRGALLTGAQGLIFVSERFSSYWQPSSTLLSFDERDCLPVHHQVAVLPQLHTAALQLSEQHTLTLAPFDSAAKGRSPGQVYLVMFFEGTPKDQ